MADTFENSRRRALPTTSLQIAALAAVTVGCVSGEVSPRRAPDWDGGAVDSTLSCPTSTAEMQKTIFAARCASAGCHGSESPALALDLLSPDLEAAVEKS
jgi:hypothetical protein